MLGEIEAYISTSLETEGRLPLTTTTFWTHVLPPTALYYLTAVLAVSGRQYQRVALLPITLFLAWRAATSIDVALAFDEPEWFAYLNYALALIMLALAGRVVEWTFRENLMRVPSVSTRLDALDLCVNLRGIGWTWSHGLVIPPWPSKTTPSRSTFLWSTLNALCTQIIVFDTSLYLVQRFGPAGVATPSGGSLYDPSLAPIPRYALSTSLALAGGFCVYSALDLGYHANALISVGIWGQEPKQWPPAFQKPWLSDSLNVFWTLRWHQLFRQSFISIGSIPLSMVGGKLGGAMGAFLVSGFFHNLGLWSMGRGTDFKSVGGFFVMQGVGAVAEVVWKRVTGKKVRGAYGRIWGIIWTLTWANILVDAWAVRGLVGSRFTPNEEGRPGKILVEFVLSVLDGQRHVKSL